MHKLSPDCVSTVGDSFFFSCIKLNGKVAAPGAAVGRIYVYKKKLKLPVESFVREGEEQSQLNRYILIKKQALDELERIRLSVQKHDKKKAEIFKAHQEIVDDIIINEEIPARILNERWAGDWAIYQVYETVLLVLRQSTDPMIAERAADFDDVRTLMLRLWQGSKNSNLACPPQPAIIAAGDLLPTDTAGLDKDNVLAILTEKGGVTSHTAIIARSYGIPTVLGIKGLLDIVKHGQLAAVDADKGTVFIEPDEKIVNEYTQKSAAFIRDRQETNAFLKGEGLTADGVKIDIGLNIDEVEDDLRVQEYADSVGLFRTEFLYMGRKTLPSEEEQFSVYKKTLAAFGKKPVILRTLDIGGDKKISSIDLPKEENPFLGNRAIRLCFSRPDIFKTQVRAALRASVFGNLWLMLPMVGSLDDIRRAKELIGEAGAELKKEGKKTAEVRVGIMIEIPSIALIADLAAKEVDFASIGSNDLCQYLCAADRMNSNMEEYYQSYHPAMFRLINHVASFFTKAGKPLSICGELGGDPLAVPVLLGLGLRKLSMGEASIAVVKRAIASVTVKACEEKAKKVLTLSTAAEVREYLAGNII
jgi:phosphotransferase system enzyme I (PtsI)